MSGPDRAGLRAQSPPMVQQLGEAGPVHGSLAPAAARAVLDGRDGRIKGLIAEPTRERKTEIRSKTEPRSKANMRMMMFASLGL
ncbi:hypothetical protein [Alsobacter sp. SYSU BS001988]